MTAATTLSSKYQISIPKAVREAQGWKPGQRFVLIPKGKGVLAIPVPHIDDIFGIARDANTKDYRDRTDRF